MLDGVCPAQKHHWQVNKPNASSIVERTIDFVHGGDVNFVTNK